MSLYYNKVQKRNMQEPEKGNLWYPMIRSIGTIYDDELSQLVSERTSLHPRDSLVAIYGMQAIMKEKMSLGYNVCLRDLGSFRLTIHASGVATLDEVTPELIKQVRIRYLPTAALRAYINNVGFIPVESLLSQITT